MRFLRLVTGVAVGAVVALPLFPMASASAAIPANAVSFSNANFSGYASGEEIHLGALNFSGSNVADVEEGYSGASVNTGGLASPITGDDAGTAGTGLLVQPSQASSVKAFGTGAGLEAGLVAPANASGDQLKLAGLAQQVAPPNGNEVEDALPSPSGGTCPEVNGVPSCLSLPDGLAEATLVDGRGAAIWSPDQTCPLGQPLSYGLGSAADAGAVSFNGLSALTGALSGLLSGLGITVPTSGNVVTNNGDAQTESSTYLTPNADGTFGLATEADTTIAPVSLNVLGAIGLQIVIGGSTNSNGTVNTASPITLTSKVTGESSGAEVSLANNDVIGLNITIAGNTTQLLPPTSIDDLIGQGGLALQLNPSTIVQTLISTVNSNPVLAKLPVVSTLLGSGPLGTLLTTIGNTLSTVTSALPNVSLGEIDLGTPPRAINSDPAAKDATTPATLNTASTSEGTSASAAFDLARVTLAPDVAGNTTNLLDLAIGHLESTATLAAPIECGIPVIKTADPTSVTAGNNFTYNIDVPNPADVALIDCSLTNVKVVDTITDEPGHGNPTFKILSANNSGVIDQTSPTTATVTWTGLTYTPPKVIQLSLDIQVLPTSPSGVIQDTAVATGTVSSCTGGASGSAGASATASNGATLTGSYTLTQPSVTAAPVTPTSTPTATTVPKTLPFTGAMGGPWQPIGGVAVLGLGGAALALVRRSRRRA